MKIVAILDSKQGDGGGFNQAVTAIIQIQDLISNEYEFEVITTFRENILKLSHMGVKVKYKRIKFTEKLLIILFRNYLFNMIIARTKFMSSLERNLVKSECDLVYFVSPSNLMSLIQNLNFISTVWDLSHIQHPEFPEVRESGEFFLRESNLRHNLPRAYLIISDSDTLTNLLIRNYGVMSERILSVPFLPSPFLSKVNKKADKTVIEEYKLVEPYFYYPAQLWAHKNHIRIFEAIKILRDSFNTKINLVLTGVDHGNFKHLDNSLRKKDLIDQVTYLGFLESSKIEKIYQNAYCIILPTYFGPTNIPPLESWKFNIPLIYSQDLETKNKESALFIDPDDVNSLVNAMLHVMDQKTRDKLIYNGQIALSNHLLNVDEQKKKLLSEIRKYENRLSTWK